MAVTVTQPSHFDLGQQIARVAAILEPLPQRLDNMEEKWDNELRELRREVAALREQRSHFIGVGVGIGTAFTFIAGLIATFGKEILVAFLGKGPA